MISDAYIEEAFGRVIEITKFDMGGKTTIELLLEGDEPYEAFEKLVGVNEISETMIKKIIARSIRTE